MDNLSYQFQSLHRQYFLSPSVLFALQLLYLSSRILPALLVWIPTQKIFPTCFNPAILDTSATFHLPVFILVKISSRYNFFYQLLLFIYVIKLQLQVIANNFMLVLYQSKNIFLLFSYSCFRKSSYKQVTQYI